MTANIRDVLHTHDDCQRLDWLNWQGRPGDVRRCVHGKVQVRTQVGPNARVAGPGTDWWRTLSPFWDRKTYRKAVAALDA